MGPTIKGHEIFTGPAFSFMLEQPSSGRKILFDLSLRKDWENFSPAIIQAISNPGWKLEGHKNVAEALQDNGINVAGGAIEAVVWSHWHFDHIGDLTTFPSSTAVITGAGVKDAFLPGYPRNERSPLLEADFIGRDHKELDFSDQSIQLGRFKSIDYFNDGSFYIIDAPGHAIGHLCGLARVTSKQEGDPEDTFILMGADVAHHSAQLRPSIYRPLPKDIKPSPCPDKYATTCPGHIFEAVHPRKHAIDAYYQVQSGIAHDRGQAAQTCGWMQEFDANDNIFVIIAHDKTLLDPQIGIEWFPNGTLNDWKAKDYAYQVRWAFLKDLASALDE
jgi:glyoxylase-like metal-dependent hydrolase (beta-lactamase superfamily II)